jgi:hypothetical protein
VFLGPISDRIAITRILLSPGGEKLSGEFAQICALLLMDLNSCYRKGGAREFDRNSPDGIRKSLSHCHDVNQRLIRANDELRKELDHRLKRIKLVLGILNGVLATVATVLALVKFL